MKTRLIPNDFTVKELQRRHWNGTLQEMFYLAMDTYATNERHASRLKYYADMAWFSPASPIFLSTYIKNALPISCFLNEPQDTMGSITEVLSENMQLAANGGGTATGWGNVRGVGGEIRGKGETGGILPFIQMQNATSYAISQGNIRAGSSAVYLPVWHSEIEDFLKIPFSDNPNGDLQFKHIKAAVVVDDAFMRAVENCEDYTIGEDNGKYRTVKAVDIWEMIMRARKLRGTPYILYHGNLKNENRLYPVSMSNLCCVTGDQLVVTSEGIFKAHELFQTGKELTLFNGKEIVHSSPMHKIKENAEVVRIHTKQGYTHDVTPDHRVMTEEGWKRADELKDGDRLSIQLEEGIFGKTNEADLAYLAGLYEGDGTTSGKVCFIDIYSGKTEHLKDRILSAMDSVYRRYDFNTYNNRHRSTPTFFEQKVMQGDYRKWRIQSSKLQGLGFKKGSIPSFVWRGDKETHAAYLSGIFVTDGTAQIDQNVSCVSLSSVNYTFLQEVQILLSNMGIKSSLTLLRKGGKNLLPDGKGGQKNYPTKDCFRLMITSAKDVMTLDSLTGFLGERGIKLDKDIKHDNRQKYAIFTHLEKLPNQDVYCVSVEGDNKAWVCNGFITHNSEILLPTCMDNTGQRRTAVCCLASLNDEYFDEWKLHPYFVGDVQEFLDNVLDAFVEKAKNRPGYEAAIHSVKQERSIGIGRMGTAYLFQKMGIPFESEEAAELDVAISKHIREQLDVSNARLAVLRGPCLDCSDPKYTGPQVRNLHTTAIAPTSTISQFLDTSSSIEPTFIAFKKDTATGEHVFINKYARKLIPEDVIWQGMDKGPKRVFSSQYLADIPEYAHLADVFRSPYEMHPKVFTDRAAARQPYLDQGQSLNIYIDSNTYDLGLYYLDAWRKGVITTYYQYNYPAQTTTSVDIVGDENSEMEWWDAEESDGPACSIDDPDCETCQ